MHPPTARPPMRPGGRICTRLVELTQALHHNQYQLAITAAHFAAGHLSYAKARTLTRVATTTNETELAALANTVPASGLGVALAGWRNRHHTAAEIDAYHHQQRSLRWRTDPDGMVTVTIRLPPHLAATLTTASSLVAW